MYGFLRLPLMHGLTGLNNKGEVSMASIVKRGKTYSVVHYKGEGKNRHQVWDSGLSYTAAKARKAQLELDQANNVHIDRNDLTVSEFLYEFLEKYGERRWVSFYL